MAKNNMVFFVLQEQQLIFLVFVSHFQFHFDYLYLRLHKNVILLYVYCLLPLQ